MTLLLPVLIVVLLTDCSTAGGRVATQVNCFNGDDSAAVASGSSSQTMNTDCQRVRFSLEELQGQSDTCQRPALPPNPVKRMFQLNPTVSQKRIHGEKILVETFAFFFSGEGTKKKG